MLRRRFINNAALSLIDINNYLTIEALEDGLTASLSANSCEYNINGAEWKTLTAGSSTESVNAGDFISFKAQGLTPTSSNGIGTFTITKMCNLLGNCMSMLYGDEAMDNNSLSGYDYAFRGLFKNCTTIKSVSSDFLPATTLSINCYNDFFYGCSSLINGPKLPATKLTTRCYQSMFNRCSKLISAPELPATIISGYCYDGMFYKCSALINIPTILPATKLYNYCYRSMFSECSNIITAPELPAANLSYACYYTMFYNCSKINYIKMLATDIPSIDYLYNWCYGVASSGTFIKNAEATWNVTGVSGVPSGWTIKTITQQ